MCNARICLRDTRGREKTAAHNFDYADDCVYHHRCAFLLPETFFFCQLTLYVYCIPFRTWENLFLNLPDLTTILPLCPPFLSSLTFFFSFFFLPFFVIFTFALGTFLKSGRYCRLDEFWNIFAFEKEVCEGHTKVLQKRRRIWPFAYILLL